MIYQAFSLYDSKSGIHTTPFFTIHPANAIRMAIDVARDQQTTVGRHPHDFTLVLIGSWDDDTGTMHAEQHTSYGTVAALLDQALREQQRNRRSPETMSQADEENR